MSGADPTPNGTDGTNETDGTDLQQPPAPAPRENESPSNAPVAAGPVQPGEGEEHYLRAVTDLGDQREIVTTEAIYTDRGLKLVDVGVRIDRKMYERLVEFRLHRPIDRSLTVAGAVDSAALVAAVRKRLETSGIDATIASAVGDVRPLIRAVESIPLPGPMAFRLTVMREQQPALFEHSLQAAVIALYLGVAAGLDAHALGRLAAAGVLHDLGMLHIDPKMIAHDRPLSPDERRHLAAHPISAMLIARDHGRYPATVLDAIVEHHERLDGTGYPQGRRDAQVSALGRILMLAEVAAAIFEKFGEQAAQRLSIILRLNHRKFDRAHSESMLRLIARESGVRPTNGEAAAAGPSTDAAPSPAWADLARSDAVRWVRRVAQALELWRTLSAELQGHEPGADSPAAFIDARLMTLQRGLNDAGYLLDSVERIVADLGGDESALTELVILGQEAQWQIANTLHATRRRWQALDGETSVDHRIAASWCKWVEDQLAADAAAPPAG